MPGLRCALALTLSILPMLAATVQASEPTPARVPSRTPLGRHPAEFLMAKITVSDLEKSYDFYTRLVGLKRVAIPQIGDLPPPKNDPERRFIEVALNFSGSFADAFFDLVQAKGDSPTPETARLTVIGVKVPDASAVVRRVREAGYEVLRDAPQVRPGEMSIGMVRDPDGYLVEIVQAADYPPES
ncbi:MAG: VOC family protein [Novosphingobium sp.]